MRIRFFDTVEEMFEAERRAQQEAAQNIHDWQEQMHKGDYFVKDSGLGFPILGKVLKEYKQKGMTAYRLCECYSVACPYGEKGDVHISTFGKKIEREEFEAIKKNGWAP